MEEEPRSCVSFEDGAAAPSRGQGDGYLVCEVWWQNEIWRLREPCHSAAHVITETRVSRSLEVLHLLAFRLPRLMCYEEANNVCSSVEDDFWR